MALFRKKNEVDVFHYLDNAAYHIADGLVQISKTTVENAAIIRSFEVQLELWELLRDVVEGWRLHPNPIELREDLQFIARKLQGGYADKIASIFEVDSSRIAPAMPQKTTAHFQELILKELPVGIDIQDRVTNGTELVIAVCFLADKEIKDFALMTKSELVLAHALSFCLFNLLTQASNSSKKEMKEEWQAAAAITAMLIGTYFSKKLDLK